MTFDYKALERQAERDRRLYDRWGKRLEDSHTGQFVAIGVSGEVIVGDNDVQVLDQALTAFGRGNFAFRRVGPNAERRWRSLAPWRALSSPIYRSDGWHGRRRRSS